jgi:hypothetical protein
MFIGALEAARQLPSSFKLVASSALASADKLLARLKYFVSIGSFIGSFTCGAHLHWRFHVSRWSCLQSCSSCSSPARARSVLAQLGWTWSKLARARKLSLAYTWNWPYIAMSLCWPACNAAIWLLVDLRARAALSFRECLHAFVEVVCGCALERPNAWVSLTPLSHPIADVAHVCVGVAHVSSTKVELES